MATHNQVRVVGYLLNDPKILNEGVEGAEKVLIKLRTVHRQISGYHEKYFEDLLVYYDGDEFMERMKKLEKYDVIDIKGVFNVLTVNKRSLCPVCGTKNVKYRGSSTFIYPISFLKLNAIREAFEQDNELPEKILMKHYKEFSNQVLLIGTVVSDPQFTGTEKHPCCRYRLGVDRKYYIKTQDDLTSDYPWVYSYGQQAERDYLHLKQGSLILVDGFIQNREVNSRITCSQCGKEYTYPDVATEFIPYSVEYLNNYITDEELAREGIIADRNDLLSAEKAIFTA